MLFISILRGLSCFYSFLSSPNHTVYYIKMQISILVSDTHFSYFYCHFTHCISSIRMKHSLTPEKQSFIEWLWAHMPQCRRGTHRTTLRRPSLQYVDSGSWLRLGGRCLHLLSHLVGPVALDFRKHLFALTEITLCSCHLVIKTLVSLLLKLHYFLSCFCCFLSLLFLNRILGTPG